jgi:hypothetical protein
MNYQHLSARSVQSIMGATDTFLSKVRGLAPIFNSGYLLIAAILLQIPANYIYAAASFKMHQPMAVAFEFQTARKHTEDAA